MWDKALSARGRGGREVGLEDRSLENVDTCRRQEGWPRKKGPRGRQVTGVRCSRGKKEKVLREKEDEQQNGKDNGGQAVRSGHRRVAGAFQAAVLVQC